MDCSGSDPEQRLSIMQDEHIGAYAFSGGPADAVKILGTGSNGKPAGIFNFSPGSWALGNGNRYRRISIRPFEWAGRTIKDHAKTRQAIITLITFVHHHWPKVFGSHRDYHDRDCLQQPYPL